MKYDGREIAGHHLELELISHDVPLPPEQNVNRANLESIVSQKLMVCDLISFPSLFPDTLKKKLLFNILLLIMTTLTVVLGR
jgi:hypothetical protein